MTTQIVPHANLSKRFRIMGLLLLVGAAAIAAGGIVSRTHHDDELKAEVDAAHVTVKTVTPQSGPGEMQLVLPGNVRADMDATIYARVSGYLKSWNTDIGAHVKKGEVLAEIETPELDQQILRARADLESAQSNWEIADVTAKRWRNLLATESVSRQEADEKDATAKARLDALNAANANLQSLLAQQSFQHIVSPFDGVVTERNTDIGKLITAGTSNGAALFRVVDDRRLRVYVDAPQSSAHLIRPDMTAEVEFPELPGQRFPAKVLGTSSAIHESSRTSTVELILENEDGKLLSGSYAEVHFNLDLPTDSYRLPVSALLFRKDGMEVATVRPDNHVTLKPIIISRDLGREVEIGSGISGNDRVIDSPPDSISEGDLVVIADTKPRDEDGAPAKSE